MAVSFLLCVFWALARCVCPEELGRAVLQGLICRFPGVSLPWSWSACHHRAQCRAQGGSQMLPVCCLRACSRDLPRFRAPCAPSLQGTEWTRPRRQAPL